MHIKKNNWNMNSISVLVKMHARHLRIWLYLHQHKLPSENKAQLISGSLICLDENEFLIDLVVRGIMQEYEVARWTAVDVFAGGQQAAMVAGVSHRQQGTAPGCHKWRIPGELRAAVARRHHHTARIMLLAADLTLSHLCTPAWFAIALQIISFHLPVTQTLLKISQLWEILFDMKPIFWFFHLWQKISRGLKHQ